MSGYKDFLGNELESGDRVILGKGGDICFGVITDIIPDADDEDSTLTWIRVKCEDSNITVDRWTNQVMKYNEKE